MLSLENLSLRYGARHLIDPFTARLAPGEHVAVMGANGCGKSTLLRVIAGIDDRVTVGGSVRVAGLPVTPKSRPAGVAWVPQDPAPPLPLTAEEFVLLGRTAKMPHWFPPGAEDRRIAAEAMAQTGTAPLAKSRMSELSGGERQRLALALALATGSGLLLLDEPTVHLDLKYRQVMIDLIASLRDKTILMVLHDLDWARQCPRVWLIEGTTLRDGPPDTLLTPENLRRAFGMDHASCGHAAR